ncbi:hypothetical protein [Phytohabitans houttuyneae]|uniref:Uncharacterized protein n=1 Tax=Phytohabitans houttuyneae TaxID=1076126 RepID=A0A6V8K644_9ACTN|nr:hypothetical protein [Phytohabitans houttuyneae]GFJ80672.1 hypothetical protein Phou_048520 [Phytohabitans houttuyneae]
MTGAGTGALREILVVLALALVGLLLAVVAAFAPWYATPADAGGGAVVEMHSPQRPGPGTGGVAVEAG